MKRGISITWAIMLMLTLACCKPQDVNKEIYKRYHDMKSYTAVVRVAVTGNKGVQEYAIRQDYLAPDCYRTEVLEPENMKGTVTVFHGEKMSFQSAGADAATLQRSISREKDYLFLPDFLAEYFAAEDTADHTASADGNQTMLNAAVRGSREERFTQNLWVDNKTLKPVRLSTFDVDGSEILRVEYESFEWNPQLEEQSFAL